MTEQYLNERVTSPDVVVGINYDPNNPVEEVISQETPVGEMVAELDRMDGAQADKTPEMEYAVAAGTPDETSTREAPMGETLYYKALVSESIVDQFLVSTPLPDMAPVSETITHEAPIGTIAGPLPMTLLDQDVSEHLRMRWNKIQGTFVDEPRTAVQQADELVSEVIEQITQMFANEHSVLEGQWKQGNDVSTEDLRKALQHYRSFFNRLVV
jgi:hypothetical protein